MKNAVPLSTLIDPDLKKAAVELCRRKGMKLRSLIELALIEQIEDEIDLETYLRRRNEDRVALEDLLSGRSKTRS